MHRSMIVLLIFVGIFLIIDLYAFQAVKTLSKGRYYINLIYWLGNAGLLTWFAYTVLSFSRDTGPTQSLYWLIGMMILFYVPKMVVMIPLLMEDLFRGARYVIALISRDEGAAVHLESRRKFISQIGLGLAAIPFISIIHGMAVGKYNYRVRREVLSFPDLPDAFDGFTITQLSDIHSGSFDNADKIKYGIDLINEQQSDLLVFTGDLVNNRADEMLPWVDTFKALKAPFGKFSILGNHDYGDYVQWDSEEAKAKNLEDLKGIHKALGFDLLLNENRNIEKGQEKFSLIGVENWGVGFKQKGDLNKAIEGVADKDFKVLLSHDPSHWDMEAKKHPKHIHLTLSGHTHGMQFGIEIPGFKWSPVKYRYPKWAGLYEEAKKYLYVNRGFGFLAFPGRVGIWPEITVLELRKGAPEV